MILCLIFLSNLFVTTTTRQSSSYLWHIHFIQVFVDKNSSQSQSKVRFHQTETGVPCRAVGSSPSLSFIVSITKVPVLPRRPSRVQSERCPGHVVTVISAHNQKG